MGRPFSIERMQAKNTCKYCGAHFTLSDKPWLSLNNFLEQKFCSRACSDSVLRPDFWERLIDTEAGCKVWTGDKYSNGYGRIGYMGKTWRTHRLAYTLSKGEIPPGMMVLHSCDNRPCCNPEHLRIGTAKENREDAILRNRVKGVFGLTLNDNALDGRAQDAAQAFGCSVQTIYRFRKERRGVAQ